MEQIKLFVTDVDGTLTDGMIYVGESGEIFKAFNVKDGYAIRNILYPMGIKTVVITGRKSEIVERRCKELKIAECYQDVHDKLAVLDEILERDGLEYSNVAYIGDDINDEECIRVVKEQGGVTACPSDAIDDIKRIVNKICSKQGGKGAVREFIEYFLQEN